MTSSERNAPRLEVLPFLAKLLIATLISASVLVAYFNFRLFRLVDEVIYASHFPTGDRLFEKLIIVKVDDKSLQLLGPWPWDRSVFARLVRTIATANASVIALDFAFEASRTKQGDVELAEIIGEERKKVVLASLHANDGPPRLYPELAAKHPLIGYVNTGTSDELESTVAYPCAPRESFRSFPELIARTYLKQNPSTHQIANVARIPESAHPMYRRFGECAHPVNFVGDGNSFKSFSASDLLEGSSATLSALAGAIVIVGPYASPHGDVHYSPVSRGRSTPGPLIVALATNTALSAIPVYPIGYWTLCLLTTGTSIVAVCCFGGRRRLGKAVVLFLLSGLAVLVFHYMAFGLARCYFPPTPLLLANFLAFLPRILELLGIEIELRS